MHRFFTAMYKQLARNKMASSLLFAVLLLLLGFFARQLRFSEDITRLIPSGEKANTTAKVLKQLNFSDKITITISKTGPGATEDLTAAATLFLTQLEKTAAPFVGKVQGRMDEQQLLETFDFVYEQLPLFLDADDYAAIDRKINRDSIAQIIESDYKSLVSPTGMVSKDFILRDPMGLSFTALKKMQQLSLGEGFLLQDGYLVTQDRKHLLLFITPKLAANETDQNTVFVEKLEQIKDQVNTQFKGKAQLGFFGATPVAVGNATQIKSDIQWTSIFAMICLVVLLVTFYRNLSSPLIIFVPSLFGAAFALAVLYFTKGSISAISLGISCVLLGETTDYSIYVLTHLRNNKNISLLYQDISKPLLLCGLTTSVTFLCLLFVRSDALVDLALFAALSVVSTSVFSLVLIPLLYQFAPQKPLKKTEWFSPKQTLIDRIAAYPYHKNKFLVTSVLLVFTACWFTAPKVRFNKDLAALNFVSPELKKAQQELEKITDGGTKSIYLATYGTNYQQVIAANEKLFGSLEKLQQQGRVAHFSSIGGLVFSTAQQQEKIRQWQHFWTPEKKRMLEKLLTQTGNRVGFKPGAFSAFYAKLSVPHEVVDYNDYKKVSAFFLDEFISVKDQFYTVSTLVKVPVSQRDAFVKTIEKEPGLVVIDRQKTNETFLGTLKSSFQGLIGYSLLAIVLILLFSFRRIELVIVSIIPLLISWIITTGVMGLFGLEFNVINIIVCTLIFGVGVDYSIFMTTALQKEHTFGQPELTTYRTSIFLSVATTILGTGVLVFAGHPALRSIALITVIGIFSALLVTYAIQPLIFNFFARLNPSKGNPPFTLRRLLHSTLSFAYYGLGGFILSLLGWLMIKTFPAPQKKKLFWFHFIMSGFMHSVLASYPAIRRRIINKNRERFDKPAIIIANHTSFLDILAIGMLSPKIIFLVSDWVYQSPIFGRGVRLAGFYPVSNGIDNGVEHLRDKVAQGFSLMVFPEGTRSVDNSVKRFHKGAFFLAETFQLDIVPVLIHGYSESSPKGDFMLYGSATTVEILDRIAPTDQQFGDTYTDKSKKINRYFREQFARLRQEQEDPNYFRHHLMSSYLYKEEAVVAAIKADFKAHAAVYHQLNNSIPAKAKLLHISNDYGQLDILLALQQSQRQISSYIADRDKRHVAQTNYLLRKRNIQYPDALPTACGPYEVLLFSTLPPQEIFDALSGFRGMVILLFAAQIKERLLPLGFSISSENGPITILTKTDEAAV